MSERIGRRQAIKTAAAVAGGLGLTLLKLETAYAEQGVNYAALMVHFTSSAQIREVLRQNITLARRTPVLPSFAANVVLGNEDNPGPMFSIIFDDCYKNQDEQAIPVLREWEVPSAWAAIGVDWLKNGADGTNRHMSVERIAELSEDPEKIEIISHTTTHRDLVALWGKEKLEELNSELEYSQRDLQNLTGQPITGICYPNGSSNPQIRQLAASRYAYGLSTIPGLVSPTEDIMNMRRIRVS